MAETMDSTRKLWNMRLTSSERTRVGVGSENGVKVFEVLKQSHSILVSRASPSHEKFELFMRGAGSRD